MLAEARLLGRAKEGAGGLSGLGFVRVGVAVGGPMDVVRDWRLGLAFMERVLVLVVSGSDSGPLIVLPLGRLRLLRTVTDAGMFVLSIIGPDRGDDRGGVLTGPGSLDLAV
jgi:hypothetical protein